MIDFMLKYTIRGLLGIVFLACLPGPGVNCEATAKNAGQGLPPIIEKPWTGDYDGMVKRRLLRVLVVHSKTFYFVDKGTPRGATYDAFTALEQELNKKLKKKHLGVRVAFVPVRRDQLIPYLLDGKGDVAAANLTITRERGEEVEFTTPILTGVNEIVVTGPQTPEIASVEDLAGQEIFVRKSSSYYESLLSLNEMLKERGKPQVILKAAPEELEDEDLLEMLNAGLVKIVVIDSHKADFWKQILQDIQPHPSIVVRSEGEIAWAIRKNSPLLKTTLDNFIKTHHARTSFGAELFRRYLRSIKYVKNATTEEEVKKFHDVVKFYEQYAPVYGLDSLLILAQGYQESRLDQSVRSRGGAIGIMQVLPTTGKAMQVGDIMDTEPNIHAGTKYIRFMIDQYYQNEPMDDLNKELFAFASYNAGPNRIQQLRKEAAKRGLDPNRWFNNVELVVEEKVGREPVQYVSNIYKYYIAYRLIREAELAREEAKTQLPQAQDR